MTPTELEHGVIAGERVLRHQPRHETVNYFVLNLVCYSCRSAFGVDPDTALFGLGSLLCPECNTSLFLTDAQFSLVQDMYDADRKDDPIKHLLGRGWSLVGDEAIVPPGFVDLVVLPAIYDTCNTCGMKVYDFTHGAYCPAHHENAAYDYRV